jgi:hypothetical protein
MAAPPRPRLSWTACCGWIPTKTDLTPQPAWSRCSQENTEPLLKARVEEARRRVEAMEAARK